MLAAQGYMQGVNSLEETKKQFAPLAYGTGHEELLTGSTLFHLSSPYRIKTLAS